MASSEPVTIPVLQQMKRDGKKSVGFVAWDYQIALIAERAGADFVSVGDSRRRQSLGPFQSAGSDARRDPGLLQGGAARRCRARC